jgi:hypothetical protein
MRNMVICLVLKVGKSMRFIFCEQYTNIMTVELYSLLFNNA